MDATVAVGPYTVIEKGASIGVDTVIGAHTMISGKTTIGARNTIGPFVTLGAAPQDLKYDNEPTEVVVGDDNVIREYTSIHRGTPSARGMTSIGNNNLLMAYSHVAHDCVIGNHVIMANAATLGGHVEVGDKATIGGLVAVHQFTRIGPFAYIGGMSGISKDVPPYVIVSGTRNRMRVAGINKIGLRRNGFDNDTIKKLNRAFIILFKTPELLLQEALERVKDEIPDCEAVDNLVRFFRESSRNVVRASSDE